MMVKQSGLFFAPELILNILCEVLTRVLNEHVCILEDMGFCLLTSSTPRCLEICWLLMNLKGGESANTNSKDVERHAVLAEHSTAPRTDCVGAFCGKNISDLTVKVYW